jgi:hypothetical protein
MANSVHALENAALKLDFIFRSFCNCLPVQPYRQVYPAGGPKWQK